MLNKLTLLVAGFLVQATLVLAQSDYPAKKIFTDGNVQGSPQSISLPYERWSPIRWLPDASGLTMVAVTRSGAGNEVALVRLADPQHPVLLTSGDPSMKSGYQLSPDGKSLLYRSTPTKATSTCVIDVAQM